jgi:hypothetical protein
VKHVASRIAALLMDHYITRKILDRPYLLRLTTNKANMRVEPDTKCDSIDRYQLLGHILVAAATKG